MKNLKNTFGIILLSLITLSMTLTSLNGFGQCEYTIVLNRVGTQYPSDEKIKMYLYTDPNTYYEYDLTLLSDVDSDTIPLMIEDSIIALYIHDIEAYIYYEFYSPTEQLANSSVFPTNYNVINFYYNFDTCIIYTEMINGILLNKTDTSDILSFIDIDIIDDNDVVVNTVTTNATGEFTSLPLISGNYKFSYTYGNILNESMFNIKNLLHPNDTIELIYKEIVAGLNNFDNMNTINIFPNPSNGIATIESESDNVINRVIITNSIGQTVRDINGINSTIINFDLTDMEKGLYIIRVETYNNVELSKYIIR